MRKSFFLASVIISTTLGAGFISGKEIFVFFGKSNNYFHALIGFIIFAIIFYLFINKLLLIVHNEKINGYHEFNIRVMDRLAFFSQVLSVVFLFVIFSTMIAAGGKAVETFIDSEFLALLFFIMPVFIVLILEGEAIVSMATVLTPIMIGGIIFLGLYTFLFQTVETTTISQKVVSISILTFINPLIYVSYNSITLVSLMCNLREYIENKKICKWSSLISSIVLTLLGILICMPLIKNHDLILNRDLPFFYILKDEFLFRHVYIFVLLLAIFTTAISSGFSLIKSLVVRYRINKQILKALLIIFGVAFSKIGFSSLVSFVYPFFGLLGFIQIYKIFSYKKITNP